MPFFELHETRADVLKLARGWRDPYGVPVIMRHGPFFVVRDDLIGGGTKSRGADLFVSRSPADHFVYAGPRIGYAGIALAMACRTHGKRFTLFLAACNKLSAYQYAAALAGAELRFVRVAAMPNLITEAKRFAARTRAQFVPLGCRDPLITAGIVAACEAIKKEYKAPKEIWSVMATGVLSRALQLGFPDTAFRAVAVGRALQPGDRGSAAVLKYPAEFHKPAKVIPPFPCIPTYDAKGWEMMQERAEQGAWFWNVASPVLPASEERYNTQREWNDLRDTFQENKALIIKA